MRERPVLLKTDGSEQVPYMDEIYPLYWKTTTLGIRDLAGTVSHWHDDLEMSYVTEGTVFYDVNGVRSVLNEGDCIFINARQLHRDLVPDGQVCTYKVAILHPSILTGAIADVDLYVQKLLTHPNYPFDILRAADPADRKLIDLITTLWERVSVTGPMKMIGTVAAAYELLYALYPRLPEQTSGTPEDRNLSTMRAMTGFIQDHYTEKITVADISRAGLVGERATNSLFKKWFSMTPLKYLMHYRLEKAIALLQSSRMSVTEIALNTGFSDANYFAISFRKHFGMSPTDYRNRSMVSDLRE